MSYPPLVNLATPAEYRAHFERVYCCGPLTTFDGITVRFRKSMFNHCFFESTNRDGSKDQFSTKRAERIDWIKAALEDANSERFAGWDAKQKRHDTSRRVALVQGNYVVVIAITGKAAAVFVTAFVADTPATLARIKAGPKWA